MVKIPRVLLMIESSRESGRKLIAGISEYARKLGPWQFVWEPQGLRGLSKVPDPEVFDGILVRDVALVETYRNSGIPMVVFSYRGKPFPGAVFAGTDDEAIAAKIAEHFIHRGFKHFGFYGDVSKPWAQNRCHYFEEVLDASGFSLSVCPLEGDGAGWLRKLPKPVALMAANDDQARMLVQMCRESGIRVPEDCAIIGVDNDPVVCGLSDPPLSSVSLDQFQAGFDAAAALDRMMRGREIEPVAPVIAGGADLIVRQSSDVVAIEDVAVSKALRFIQQNASRALSVDEIAVASGLFRRGLERRFRVHLDQTIQERYHEERANYVTHLISETNLSLEIIAEKCGFPQPSHLTRFFKKMRGMSPSEYRLVRRS